MKIHEQYTTARAACSLKVEVRTTHAPADVLAAAGMAARTSPAALALWTATLSGRTGAKKAVVEILASKLAGQMAKARWKGDPRRIASEVVAWYLHGVCKPCSGRGYETIPGTPALSERLCQCCGGTGRIRLPDSDAYAWLSRNMDGLISSAGGKVLQKLVQERDLM